MRAVVTGCAGFIGSHLVERLLSEGWSVTGIDGFAPTYDTSRRRAVAAELGRHGRFELIEGNLNKVDLRPHLADATAVFHLAARPGVRASWADFSSADEANVLATQRVLDAMVGLDGVPLVFASSSSVYGDGVEFPAHEDSPLHPISPYGVTKAAGESLVGAYASQFGIRAASLRYFTVFGPRQRSDMAFTRWIRNGLAGEPLPLFGDGSAIRDFTYVADVVDATIRASRIDLDGHEAFNVAGGSPVSVAEVLEHLATLIDRPLEISRMDVKKGDPHRTGGSTEKLRSRTGWEPKTDWREGLRLQVEWLRSLSGS